MEKLKLKNEWDVGFHASREKNPDELDKNGQTYLCKQYFNFSEPKDTLIPIYEEKPDGITICISTDVDLPKIHLTIRDVIIYDMKERRELIEKGNDILENLKLLEQSSPEYENLSNELDAISTDVNEITENIKKWLEYSKRSLPILNRYSKVMSNEVKRIIGSNNSEDNSQVRLDLILEYLNVIEDLELLSISKTFKYDDNIYCPVCGTDISLNETIVDGKYICDCGYYDEDSVVPLLQTQEEFSTMPVTKTKTDVVLKMDKWLSRFLGTSDEKFDEEKIFHEMDQICIKEGWPTSDQIKTEEWSDIHQNLDRLISLLFMTKNSKLYSLKNIIRHKYWGWPLPTLTDEQKSRFLNKVSESAHSYDVHKKREQDMNQEIRGWYHLNDVGAHFPKSWYKMTGRTEDLESDDEVYKNVCKDCNMKFVPIVDHL